MDEDVDFEEESFRNRVLFYRDKLLKIHRGEAGCLDLFTVHECRRNRFYGVWDGESNNRVRLTERTLRVLGVDRNG